jgi:hypothetical protein
MSLTAPDFNVFVEDFSLLNARQARQVARR